MLGWDADAGQPPAQPFGNDSLSFEIRPAPRIHAFYIGRGHAAAGFDFAMKPRRLPHRLMRGDAGFADFDIHGVGVSVELVARPRQVVQIFLNPLRYRLAELGNALQLVQKRALGSLVAVQL